MFKRLTSLLCALVLSISFGVCNTANAAVVTPDAPAYSYTNECNSYLSVSGTTATCESYATGYYNKTDKVVIKQILQKKTSSVSWEDVCSWTTTVYSFHGSAINNKYSLSSGTYRLKTVFTVYAGTSYETITKYSKEKTI